MRSTPEEELVLLDLADGLLTVTLNRPKQRNAIDAPTRDALLAAFDEAGHNQEIAAVILTGAGTAFCAGGDLGSFEELHDARAYRHLSHRLTTMLEAVERLEKPVIAAINGTTTGVGLTLALCADWRIAAPGARLMFREGRLGLVPTHGGIARLVKLVGLARAKEALLGGDDLDAAHASRLGLVNEIAEDELLEVARNRASRMLERAPLSFGAAKQLLHLAADTDVRSTILAESLAQTGLLRTDDHLEGLAAIRERRRPEFAGR